MSRKIFRHKTAISGIVCVALLLSLQTGLSGALASELTSDDSQEEVLVATQLTESTQDPVILTPAEGAVLTGSVEVTAHMADGDKIMFFIEGKEDGTQYYLGRANKNSEGSWSLVWDTTETPDGNYALMVSGYIGSGKYIGNTVNISIDNEAETVVDDPDDGPDVISADPEVLHPTANSVLTGEVEVMTMVTATAVHIFALDENDKLYFIGHGENQNEGDWLYNWETNKLGNGDYFLYVVAYDAMGGQRQSELIKVTLQNTEIITMNDPQINITEPEGEVVAESSPDIVLISDDDSQNVNSASIQNIPVIEGISVSDITVELRKTSGGTSQGYIHLMGKAPVDSSITLYIFSDPIVATTRTDDNGDWVYTLDHSLEEGTHEVYITVSDANNNVIGRSGIMSFLVETAVAAQDLQTETLVSVASSNRSLLLNYMLLALGLVVGVLFVFIILNKVVKKNRGK